MPDDVSKPKFEVEPAAQAAARPKREARPRSDIDPVEAGIAAMDRHPTFLTQPRPGRDPMDAAEDFITRYPIIMARLAE